MSLKRLLGAWIGTVLSAMGLFVAGLYLVANVQVAFCALRADSAQVLGVANEIVTKGCAFEKLRHFEAVSYDFSAITPLLLTLFFRCLTLNFGRTAFGRVPYESLTIWYGTLPFSKNYEKTWVQLGLVGTIYGFLIIGWSLRTINPAKISEIILPILLNAFGTALLSTFTAVVLSFVFAPLLLSVWNWLHDLEEPTPSVVAVLADTTQALQVLRNSMKKASGEITEASSMLKRSLDETATALRELKEQLPTSVVEELRSEVNGIRSASELTAETVGGVVPTLHEIKAPIESIANGLGKVNDSLGHVKTATDRVTDGVLENSRKIGELLPPIQATQAAAADYKSGHGICRKEQFRDPGKLRKSGETD